MIVTRIWGGLGNQLFQYAFGYAIAKDNGEELRLDTTFYGKQHNSRQTERTLDMFKLPINNKKEINPVEISRLITFLQKPSVNYLIRRLLPKAIRIGKLTYVKEDKLQYLPEVTNVNNKYVYYDGYWHSDRYFAKYREEIIEQFVYSNKSIEDEYSSFITDAPDGETVAVHIRRGDYITQNNPNAMGIEYYRAAIEKAKTIIKKPIFCFFSDDPEWVKNNFSNIPQLIIANYHRSLNDIEEFQLMAKCKHQIISNSSYSWWAAWLNNNNNKIVIVPKVWHGKKDMMLDSWIKI